VSFLLTLRPTRITRSKVGLACPIPAIPGRSRGGRVTRCSGIAGMVLMFLRGYCKSLKFNDKDSLSYLPVLLVCYHMAHCFVTHLEVHAVEWPPRLLLLQLDFSTSFFKSTKNASHLSSVDCLMLHPGPIRKANKPAKFSSCTTLVPPGCSLLAEK